jgi:DNA polymerase-3 subunit alpha
MAAPYVPLRIFSCYTMLEGAIEPKAIAKQAKKLDFPAAALTDRNGLYAAMPFTDACKARACSRSSAPCWASPGPIAGEGGR